MDITVEPHTDATAVVRLDGRLDLLVAQQVKQRLATAVEEGYSTLIIDMAPVSFLDSSGLGALISGLKATRSAGGNLLIAHAGPQVRQVLEVSTLDRILKPYNSIEEALSESG